MVDVFEDHSAVVAIAVSLTEVIAESDEGQGCERIAKRE
jgi:hypothetical protein